MRCMGMSRYTKSESQTLALIVESNNAGKLFSCRHAPGDPWFGNEDGTRHIKRLMERGDVVYLASLNGGSGFAWVNLASNFVDP